jgi:hypothetical protein
LFVLAACSAAVASADVTIRIKETEAPGSKKPRVSTGTMAFNATSMATRWERGGDDDDHGRVIFRGDKELLWIVQDGKRSYQTIDKAALDRMAAQVSDAKAQMEASLAKMSPEQRAQTEAMMKKFGGGMPGAAPAKRIDYRKTAETRMVNGHLCTKYDTYWGGELVSYAWVAPYSAMKLAPGDAAVFKKMAEFVNKMTAGLGRYEKQDFMPMNELNGIPLLTQQVEKGKVTSETLVESVSRAPLAPGTFDLPAGYKAEPMPGAERRK